MTVSELILKIDEILNLDLSSSLDVSSQTVIQAMEQNSCCKTLLACCNFVLDELYSEYALDCRNTVVNAVDGIIEVSNLNLRRVLSLTDSAGQNTPFKHSLDGLTLNRCGKYNLTYARKPPLLTFASAINIPDSKISERIFVYGVIAEYLRVIGDYSASSSWAGKYLQALQAAMSKTACAKLPCRRWLL